MNSFIYSFIYSFIHLFIHSIHWYTGSSINQSISKSVSQLSINSPINGSAHSFIHSVNRIRHVAPFQGIYSKPLQSFSVPLVAQAVRSNNHPLVLTPMYAVGCCNTLLIGRNLCWYSASKVPLRVSKHRRSIRSASKHASLLVSTPRAVTRNRPFNINSL